jgi:hypothetical protein
MMFNDWHGDVQISLEGEANEYRLIIKALDENTGIAYGERETYEAPESGYQQEMVVPIKTLRNDIKADFFVKGRDGQFFSVLRIDLHALESSVYVDIGYGTNPNGSRNLEPSAELQEEYLKKKYRRE